MAAKEEQRLVRSLSNYDYLVGIEDLTRMGGIRNSTEDNGTFINADSKYSVPPLESLRALCDACEELESAEERNELPQQRWLDQLVDPGSSLGGARPKANVVDADGKRRHFASAMSLLGLDDGCGATTGNGYLDIVDFIVSNCTNVQQNLLDLQLELL